MKSRRVYFVIPHLGPRSFLFCICFSTLMPQSPWQLLSPAGPFASSDMQIDRGVPVALYAALDAPRCCLERRKHKMDSRPARECSLPKNCRRALPPRECTCYALPKDQCSSHLCPQGSRPLPLPLRPLPPERLRHDLS